MKRSESLRIRLLATLALILLTLIALTGLLLIITNPGLAVLYLAAGIALVIGAWLMLSARRRGFWAGVILMVFALAGSLSATVIFFGQADNSKRFLFLVVLSVIYVALVGYIARFYWRSRRFANHQASRIHDKPVLIINPRSGNGRATKAHLAEHAEARGIEVMVMQLGQDMAQLAERAIAQGATVLGISGGDGSLGVVAKIAIEHDVPMVVLPGGTRCHFARDLGLNPNDILDALAGFDGIEVRVDVGTLGDRVFLNNASFGLYAEISRQPEYREHKIETAQRVMHVLATGAVPYYPLTFTDGNGTTWEHAALALIGVNQYETLRLGELGERKHLDQGLLQVTALRALDGLALKQLSRRTRFSMSGDSMLSQWNTHKFTVSHPSGWLYVGLDGETLQVASPVHIRIMPKALRLRVPAEGIRHRAVRPISTSGARTLWDLITAKPKLTA